MRARETVTMNTKKATEIAGKDQKVERKVQDDVEKKESSPFRKVVSSPCPAAKKKRRYKKK